MSAEDVDEAVRAAKFSSAEDDEAEIVARMLEIPRDLVVRVWAARELIEDTWLATIPAVADSLGSELKTAYSATLRRGLTRMRVRHAIRDGEPMSVPLKKLVKTPAHICNGCPYSIRCVTENFSTPEECLEKGLISRISDRDATRPGWSILRSSYERAVVVPTQIRGDKITVECEHPRGKYVVDVGDIVP